MSRKVSEISIQRDFRRKVKLYDNAEENFKRKIEELAKINPLLQSSQPIAEITNADVDDMGFLLSNIADCLANSMDKAFTLLSSKLSWLFTHNLPG